MNTFTVVLLLETGNLRTLHVMAPTAHEARRTVASWIGKQHTDAVRLVSLTPVDRTPAHRAEGSPALPLQAAMILAGLLLIALILTLLTP